MDITGIRGIPPSNIEVIAPRATGSISSSWKDPAEKYNDGKPFKICARDDSGVIVTIIADNYFGYSKKEVKGHISYSSNLMGLTEEEHSGGALVFPAYNLGNRFLADTNLHSTGQTMEDVVELLRERIELNPSGYAIDRSYPDIVYLPETATISLKDQFARGTGQDGQEQLHPQAKQPGSFLWLRTGTRPHRPSQ
jgi:hypothetical protein